MLFAHDWEDKKILASPGEYAYCPYCDGDVVAKCGDINIWHWAHMPGCICDSWSEGETAWHLDWKSRFPPDTVEITVTKDDIRHRADVIINGVVVEFQHSHISPEQIRERESFYGKNMIWVFDIRDVVDNDRFLLREHRGNWAWRKSTYWTFRWLWCKKHIMYTTADVYLDLGSGELFRLKKLYSNGGGWGYRYKTSRLINRLTGVGPVAPLWACPPHHKGGVSS